MKLIKIPALAALAAATLTALLAAERLRQRRFARTTRQRRARPLASGSTSKFSAEESIKLTGPFSLLIFTCSVSTLEGPTTSTGGGSGVAVTAEVKGLTLDSCIRPTTVGTKGTLSFQNIAGSDNGTVASSGLTITLHEIPVFGTCSYVTNNTDLGTITGSLTTPTFVIRGVIPPETEGCPSGTWTGR